LNQPDISGNGESVRWDCARLQRLTSVRLLVALLARVWEVRTPAKLGVPNIFERLAWLIDKGMDNHDPVVPKSKIKNPSFGVATLRIADEMQFVGAKRTTFGFHCLNGTLPRRELQARQQFFGQGVQEISSRVGSSQQAALSAAFDAPETSEIATGAMTDTLIAASLLRCACHYIMSVSPSCLLSHVIQLVAKVRWRL
jgi:hypothetical protein